MQPAGLARSQYPHEQDRNTPSKNSTQQYLVLYKKVILHPPNMSKCQCRLIIDCCILQAAVPPVMPVTFPGGTVMGGFRGLGSGTQSIFVSFYQSSFQRKEKIINRPHFVFPIEHWRYCHLV